MALTYIRPIIIDENTCELTVDGVVEILGYDVDQITKAMSDYGWFDEEDGVRVNKKFLKGICYEPFPLAYNPSTCNNTCLFFGSDIAAYNLKPLWGDSFTPLGGPDAGTTFKGRNDLKNISELGANLIRLYDWDARNDHIPFLDCCEEYGLQVLVPVSNYNLGAFGTPPPMEASITGLINSFTKVVNGKRDYHPAIYGIIIGSETDQLANVSSDYLIEYTKKWVQIESIAYSGYRKVPIGHPISFAMQGPGWGGEYPCFGYLDKILPPLKEDNTNNLSARLMICPHTYNEADYLYKDAQGSGKGWVELCYDQYNIQILFCEMGCSRLTRNDYLDVISDQLTESIDYDKETLLGTCYFQYCDKSWMSNTTEGSFGLVKNTEQYTDIIKYGNRDFNHCTPSVQNELEVQILEDNDTFEAVKEIYSANIN
jgi:hypothetical protein